MRKMRLNMDVSADTVALIDDLAEREGVTRTEIIRRALSVMKAFKEQMAVGRVHMGFSASPDRMDAVMIGILTVPAADTPPPETSGEGGALYL